LKTTKIILIIFFILFIIFSIYFNAKFVVENSKLRNAVKEGDVISDSYYSQLKELAFIFENVCNDKDQFALYKAISIYQDLRDQELEKMGLEYIVIPKINISDSTKVLYGYNGNLKFYFDGNGKLKEIKFPTYGKVY